MFYFNGKATSIADSTKTVTAAHFADGSPNGTTTPPTIGASNPDV